jgi:hypothetical protein
LRGRRADVSPERDVITKTGQVKWRTEQPNALENVCAAFESRWELGGDDTQRTLMEIMEHFEATIPIAGIDAR